MKRGVHLVERFRLPALRLRGLEVPDPWLGILDLLRAIEGHLPEPVEKRAIGILGLDGLLAAGRRQEETLMPSLRTLLYSGRHYFEWKEIPLVFLVDARIGGEHDAGGAFLELGDAPIALAPIFGRGLQPMQSDLAGWWWAAQLG
ncbi:MAG: hypothetical protein RBU30_19240 [Polyangia bacterium]|jgi:hypothetical protein|nr:hypothetical protein [Polyangia bacterium]